MSIKDKVINFLSIFPDSYLVLLDDKKKHLPIKIGNKLNYQKMLNMNKKGYGVFFTPNGHKRGWKSENLKKINSWYVDIDKGKKESQKALIAKSPLKPSVIVETKQGFHLYWLAKDASKDNFDKIESCLVNYFNADKHAKKISQLLRVPYFTWNKTNYPFIVKLIKKNKELIYTEESMIKSYKMDNRVEIDSLVPVIKTEPKLKNNNKKYKDALTTKLASIFPEEFSQGIKKEDSRSHLLLLSGTEYVKYENYDFKLNSNGTEQIYVNGKPSSCWIRKDGSIGSLSGGSPSIIQWIKWFER